MNIVKKKKPYKFKSCLSRNISGWVLLIPSLLLFFLIVWRPIGIGIGYLFFRLRGFTPTEFVGLANYKDVLTDTKFFTTLWNTAKYVFFSVVIGFSIPFIMALLINEVVLGKYFVSTFILIIGRLCCDILVNGLCGYALSRLKPMGSKIVETLVFWYMLLPGISMVPLYMTFVDMPILHINLIGSYVPLILTAGANAFNVLLFRNFFNSIPMSYLEAARIDGTGDFRIFFRIILPLAKLILAVVCIFSVTGTWGDFMWAYLILGNT